MSASCRRLLCALWLAVATPAAPAGQALTRFTYTEPHMGTRFKLVLFAPDEASADKVAKVAFARVATLDNILSDYKPASELMRLCAQAGGAPVPVSDDRSEEHTSELQSPDHL